MRHTLRIDEGKGMTGRTQVTGGILAGGRGLRMGGVDKGLVEHSGRALVAHMIERLQPQVGSIVISANRNVDRYSAFGHPV
ncbi:MAG TPA: NTP transferase domain-containing protein, partial [Pseudomonadota bacterium]|nr:NTP transferase domain-containing protein [Pseudomonadota bacterium]